MDTAIVQLLAAKDIHIYPQYFTLKIVYSKKSNSKVKHSSMKFDYLEGDNEKRKGKIGSTMSLLLSRTYIFLYFYPCCPLENH